MCGRFALVAHAEQLQMAFNLDSVPSQMVPRFNIAPTQPIAVITNHQPKNITFQRWGLIPSWAKDLSMGSTLINARAETAAEKPSFRSALKRRRCLIPATGFYEWPKKGANPIYVQLKQDPIFAFAGLWETWHGPDGEELDSCTILTTEPNDFMRQYHHRMAVVLSPDRYADWLTPTELSGPEALSLLEMVPQEMMQVYEVSKLVNNVGVDSPDCIEPVGGQASLL